MVKYISPLQRAVVVKLASPLQRAVVLKRLKEFDLFSVIERRLLKFYVI